MTVKLRTCVLLVMAELAWACTLIAVPSPASAQFFDNFPFFNGSRGRRSMPSLPFFDQPRARQRAQQRPVQQGGQQGDYAHAPPPTKTDREVPPDLKTIVVMGDSMADWLAYGLDQTFADTPEMAIVRKYRTFSSLIYNPGRHDPRNSVDWPVAAREMLANEPANFIVMMIGLSDRDPIRVAAVPPRPAPQAGAKPGQPSASKPGQPDAGQQAEQTKPAEAPDAANSAVADPGTPAATYEFKTEKWVELYGKRIDETIAALKSKGVPVFWVGLPPILGARSTADMQYLNDLFRSHAEKAGITYIDIWDGFADDGGRFTMQGPDYEGQIRRLRTPDGVYFTPAGARKLAHYVEREIQRALTPTGPIAVPLPSEPLLDAPVASQQQPGGGTPRPLAGPVVPLNASVDASKSDQLLGGAAPQQAITDAVATRVLVKGDPMPAPAGRADDFAWPRRAPAAVGADPVVATTTLPMTPMVASSGATQQPDANAAAAAAAARAKAAQQQAAAAHARQRAQQYSYRQQSPFFFFFGR
jgi:uncharacterized protein